MYDRQLLVARLHGSRSPYGMQHGSERRLLGRLLGPATMNRSSRCPAARVLAIGCYLLTKHMLAEHGGLLEHGPRLAQRHPDALHLVARDDADAEEALHLACSTKHVRRRTWDDGPKKEILIGGRRAVHCATRTPIKRLCELVISKAAETKRRQFCPSHENHK